MIVALVQLDIETLSLHRTNAVVGAVGVDVAVLDNEQVLAPDLAVRETHYWRLDVEEQLRDGREMDWDTVSWWLRQSDAARQEMAAADKRYPLAVFADEIRGVFDRVNDVTDVQFYLASAPEFDFGNVQAIMEAAGHSLPVKHYQIHNQRTIRQLLGAEKRTAPVAHRADTDAQAQNDEILTLAVSATPAAGLLYRWLFRE